MCMVTGLCSPVKTYFANSGFFLPSLAPCLAMLHCKIHCGIPGNRYLPMYREETGLGGQAAGWAGWHDPTLTRLTGDPGRLDEQADPLVRQAGRGRGPGEARRCMDVCIWVPPTPQVLSGEAGVPADGQIPQPPYMSNESPDEL